MSAAATKNSSTSERSDEGFVGDLIRFKRGSIDEVPRQLDGPRARLRDLEEGIELAIRQFMVIEVVRAIRRAIQLVCV